MLEKKCKTKERSCRKSTTKENLEYNYFYKKDGVLLIRKGIFHMYDSNFRKTKIHNLNILDLNFPYRGHNHRCWYQNPKCIY